jgi:2-polyprenyl-6-methoxyphenol hydroxylase-like FAD-dependent oxidoreductase
LEDAAVLSRCLTEIDDVTAAFQTYQATRLERTARVQLTSRQNTWGKQAEDTSSVYGYDAWQTPLVSPQLQAAG